MTMIENIPNFYNLLELDPSEDWDENKFRQVLKAKQQQWSRQSMGMGQNVLTAKRNLELIAEIESVMKDPVARELQAQAAKAAQGAKNQARLVEFEQQLQGTEQKGYLEEAEKTSPSSDRPTVSQAESTPNGAKQADHEQARVPQRPTVDEIRELQAQNIGSALRLTWFWPPDCYEACVYYSNQEWPEPSRNRGGRIRVTRAEYESGGHYDLYGAMDQTYYIVVTAVLRHGGKQMMTPGVRTEKYLTPQISLRYEIKNPRFWHKQRTLHLYTDTPCSIPTLVLRSKRNTLPLTKEEGEEFYREVGPILVSTKKIIPLPDTSFPPDTYARLFLADDNLYDRVIIQHPHERRLRLG